MDRTLFLLQGGGPTAVVNTTLASILESALPHFSSVHGLAHSFEGDPDRPIIDLSSYLDGPGRSAALRRLAATPGALLGSSRKKVEERDLERILRQMQAARADALVGIGGNGTMAALKLMAEYAAANGYDIDVIGAPKTVDNDLPGVHVAPGYGSAARFVAMAVRDFDRDFRAMATFDAVTILETMGRDTGWIAAASVLLRQGGGTAPHMVLVPERPVDEAAFLEEVHQQYVEHGRVFIVVNEMLNASDGGLIGKAFQNGPRDSMGRHMYSLSLGTGNYLAHRIMNELKLQTRCLRPGNLGRALSFCVSEPDRDLARRVGKAAVAAVAGNDGAEQMITIDENLNFGRQPLGQCVGTRALPGEFLAADPVQISKNFNAYARPFIGDVEHLLDFSTT